MSIIHKVEKASLKKNQQINENVIQSFIFNDPAVLGLGELIPIVREKNQPSGGRLDLLLGDDNGTRYEVEIQLGATDPSHIIRTIEYWDTEKKRYPQYNHCAVLVAEEITGRFMNIISLFNGAIPIIAIQISAYKDEKGLALTFTKIMDSVYLGTDEEEETEIADRAYWEKRSSPKMLKVVDDIFKDVSNSVPNYALKYNKFYIGVAKEGVAKNFIIFKPKKNFMYLVFKGNPDSPLIQECENKGFDVAYQQTWKEINIKIAGINDYKNNKDLFDKLLKLSMEQLNIDE